MSILICVAGMPHSESTVRFAGVIAGIGESPVTLIHVVRRKGDQPTGERVLAHAGELLPGLAVDRRVRSGDPTRAILAEGREGDYDLIVVGASQRMRLRERLAGSVTLQVLDGAPCSVLVVREGRPALERMLICTGGTDKADPVIEAGARLAGAAGARATLLHVVNPVPSMYTGLAEVEETLSELLSTNTPIARHLRHGAEILAQHRVNNAELELRRGVAVDEILREAYREDHDLIVIGSSGVTDSLKGWMLGNLTRQIVTRARCPILVVKPRIEQLR